MWQNQSQLLINHEMSQSDVDFVQCGDMGRSLCYCDGQFVYQGSNERAY